MRFLVTGATGHIGSSLAETLASREHEVAVVVRSDSDLWRLSSVLARVRVIRGDLSAVGEMAAPVKAFAPDVVLHLGWQGVSRVQRDSWDQLNVNLAGSIQFLRMTLEIGCAMWLGLGSQAEYGIPSGMLRETQPARPTTLYGIAKHCLALASKNRCAASGVKHGWLRLLATYGPKDDPERFIPRIILDLLNNRVPRLTAGYQRHDYLYVADAAEAIATVGLGMVEGVFNLASGEAHTVRSIAERIRNLVDPSLQIDYGAVPYRSEGPINLEADISRLRGATGWAPKVALPDGLCRTVDWFRDSENRNVAAGDLNRSRNRRALTA